MIRAYAGIGSRDVTVDEKARMNKLASELSDEGWYLYSGHADGSDYAFEYGSDRDKAVIWLPWEGFNGPTEAKYWYVVGDNVKAQESVDEYHPSPKRLGRPGRALMARNYYQIMGDGDRWPVVSFVVCCSEPDRGGGVKGGTGQAVRMAMDKGIPVFNLRVLGLDEVRDKINKI